MDKIGFNSIKRVSLQTFLIKWGNLSNNFIKKRIQIEIRQQEKHYENLSALLFLLSASGMMCYGEPFHVFLKKLLRKNSIE